MLFRPSVVGSRADLPGDARPGRVPRVPVLHPLPFVSVLLIMLFWATLYYEPVAQITFGNKGRICIIILWWASLAFAGAETLRLCLRRAFWHRAEWILLAGWLLVHVFHLVFKTGANAYSQFANAGLSILAYIGAVIHLRNDPRQFRVVAFSILAVLGGISLILVPIVYREPFFARTFNEAYVNAGHVQLIGSWGLFACYAIAIPSLLAFALQDRSRRWIWPIALCASMIALVFIGTFAASIMLMTIGMGAQVLFFLVREKRFWAKTAVVGLVLIVFGGAYWKFSNLEQFDATVIKLTNVATGVASEGVVKGEPTTRGYLAAVSWRTFLSHPVFGVGPLDEREDNYTLIGQHAGFIDGLARYGLVGYGWYLAFVAFSFRRVYRLFRERPSLLNDARMATCLAFFVGGFINPYVFDAAFLTLFYVLVLALD